MTDYRPSRYNILIPLKGDRTLAYNGMSGASAVWESDDAECFDRVVSGDAGLPSTSLDELRYGGFIVASHVNELELLRREYDARRYDPKRMVLTIAPTLMCNFGCDYCFQGRDKPCGVMSDEVQSEIVNLASRVAPSLSSVGVAWYGGEPLLALNVIESLSDKLINISDKQSLSYEGSIVTNGYKLTAAVARTLHNCRVVVAQITLDGAEDCHDKRRTLLGGQPTFNRIADNLREILDETPIRITVRVNIDDRNASSIRSLLDRLAERGFGGRNNFNVYFAPVEAITAGCHNVTDLCMSKSAYGELEADLTRYAFDRQLMSLPYPPRFHGLCGALRPRGLVIAPNGDLHKCWDTISMPDRKVGTIFDIDSLRANPRAQAWARWTPFDNDGCRDCRLLPNCAGACAHKTINADQTSGAAASIPCPSWKYNVNERLVLMAEKRGLLGADDYDPELIRTNPSQLNCSAEATSGRRRIDEGRTLDAVHC
jgi:uncharacterized protein